MSAPVDVLAVLDDDAALLDRVGGYGDDLRVARDAVAELIEAARAHTVTPTAGFDRPALYFSPSQADRLLEALARVEGGAE